LRRELDCVTGRQGRCFLAVAKCCCGMGRGFAFFRSDSSVVDSRRSFGTTAERADPDRKTRGWPGAEGQRPVCGNRPRYSFRRGRSRAQCPCQITPKDESLKLSTGRVNVVTPL
jgi:hypothetical protein